MGSTVKGLDVITGGIRGAAGDVEDPAVMGAVADAALGVMRPLIPRRTGALGGSAQATSARGTGLVTIGGGRIAYARVIRYGSPRRNIRPSRFVERTETTMTNRATALLEDEWNQITQRRGLT